MPRPWTLLDSVDTPDGRLELRQRDARDFMISVDGRVLMSSLIHHSEVDVAELACARIPGGETPRVLVGGLGLGYTLRAALDALPSRAMVEVAELNERVVAWCAGPLAHLTQAASTAANVRVRVADVADMIRKAARGPGGRYDAIIVDLYVGPSEGPGGERDPLYGSRILGDVARALRPGGVYAVWSEEPSRAFEGRLRRVGLQVERVRTRAGGPRHAVYLARRGQQAR